MVGGRMIGAHACLPNCFSGGGEAGREVAN